MKEKKVKQKKYYHPITSIIFFTVIIILLSGILSFFEIAGSYSKINPANMQLETVLVNVENLFNYQGFKYIISEAAKNFVSFAPLNSLLICLIGISIAEATGLIDAVIKRHTLKLHNKSITFLIIFFGTISTIINDVGFVILIPISAIIFLANGRNPIAGIVTAFCATAFGYGATLFVGSLEVNLISITTLAARLIDPSAHISLTSNLYISVISVFILSWVGTIIIEKIIIPKIGKYKESSDLSVTREIEIIDFEKEEHQKLEEEINSKKGLSKAYLVCFILIGLLVYSLIPSLPFSGLLLDMKESTYLRQLFGPNAYFQEGFTFLVSMILGITGIVYGIYSKNIKSDRDLFDKVTSSLKDVGSLIVLLFFFSQFIAIFKKTNIGTIICIWLTNIIGSLNFTGLPLILITVILIAIANLFITSPYLKWNIFAPLAVPALMQSNVTPQFAQYILRAADSMTKGITPFMAYFVIYLGYLNIYNRNKKKPITIKEALRYVAPYCLIISVVWISIILGWYIIGIQIGPRVLPVA